MDFRRYKEWYYDAMVPFVHYIPIALDFSDLCEKYQWIKSNPAAAQAMSDNARQFFLEHLHPRVKDFYVYEILRQWSALYDKHVTQRRQRIANTTAPPCN